MKNLILIPLLFCLPVHAQFTNIYSTNSASPLKGAWSRMETNFALLNQVLEAGRGSTVLSSPTANISLYANDGEIEFNGNRFMIPFMSIGDNAFHLMMQGGPSGEGDVSITAGYVVTAGVIAGTGAGFTNLNGSSISSGTVADARIDSAIARDSEVLTATNSLNTSLRASLAQTNIFDGRTFTNIGTVGHPAANSSFVTNGATVWFTTNAAPGNTALPNGSFATVTDGTFWVRTNSTWVRK